MQSSPMRQLAIQAAAAILVFSLLWPYHGFTATPIHWPITVVAIGGLAALFASLLRQPWWWRCMHALFAPLALWTTQWRIDPGWFLLGFIVLLLIYRGALATRVPLYLSGDAAVAALSELIESRQATQPVRKVVDLGAGVGSMLAPLAAQFPDIEFVGVENSPAPWLFGWLRTRGLRNVHWRYGDMWQTPLNEADLVYAFLSPAPMPQLKEKLTQELRPQALFVSNSFPLPETPAASEIEAGWHTLFVYPGAALSR